VIPWLKFVLLRAILGLGLNTHWHHWRRGRSRTSISAAGEVFGLNPFRPEVQQFITE